MWLSVPITIILVVPSSVLAKRTSGGHVSLGASAKLLSGHAGGPRAAAGDTTFGKSDHLVDRKSMSQPVASPATNRSGRTSPPSKRTFSVRKSSGGSGLLVGSFLAVRVTDEAKRRRQGLVACRAAVPFEGF